jgi:hypothetical protein
MGNCSNTIKHKDKWKYVNMNPEAPQILGTITLHKENKPNRPIINWKNSPGYKLVTHVAKLLKHSMQLPNIFNAINSKELIHSVKIIKEQGKHESMFF